MKKLNVAVIGVGYLGRFHAQKYASLVDVNLVGVVDIDRARSEHVAHEVGTKAYTSVEEIPETLDAVSIAVPTSSHAEVAVPLLEKGIAVLVEKPISSSSWTSSIGTINSAPIVRFGRFCMRCAIA